MGIISLSEQEKRKIERILKRDLQSTDFWDELRCDIDNYQLKSGHLQKISVIISTHNRPYILPRTLCGIFEQEYSNFEIIIVDDSDNEDTEKLIKSLRSTNIKYYHEKQNYGGGISKKTGYFHADGEIIIFSDDDDFFIDDEYFDKLIDKFTDQSYIMTISNTITLYEEDNSFSVNRLNVEDGISNSEYFSSFQCELKKPTSMFPMALRKDIISKIKYDELLFFGDTSLYLYALLAEGRVGVIDDYVGVYRVSSNSVTGHSNVSFTLINFESKYDIFKRAINRGVILIKPE